MTALWLHLKHPELPSCDDCQKWLYDATTWEISKDAAGKPVKRWPGCPLPCVTCPKIPAGAEPSPKNALEVLPECRSIYHYELLLREDVSHILPRDSITIAHAAMIRDVERRLHAGDDSRMMGQLMRSLMMLRGR